MSIRYRSFGAERLEEIKRLYREEEWNAYLRDDPRLVLAFGNSLWCYGAFDESNELIGFIRCVGDGAHCLIVQDLIVDKAHRNMGIGKTLFRAALEQYRDVRAFQVNTDIDDEPANRFYRSFGLKEIREYNMISYIR